MFPIRLHEDIKRLKRERNAVILAHSYQRSEVIEAADIVGDSLRLSLEASKATADVIVFCGVHFMAETAKILNPTKTVLLPVKDAGCPMADMVDAKTVRLFKSNYPGLKTACYINTSAEVKAECDYCVTSSNAVKLVKQELNGEDFLFFPDKNLGEYISEEIGFEQKVTMNNGYCPVHEKITANMVLKKLIRHPQAVVIAHPECKKEVRELADVILSTERMIDFPSVFSMKKTFIVCTEVGIEYRMRKANPNHTIVMAYDKAVCADMKKTKIEDVYNALDKMEHIIDVDPETAQRARVCIERMLKVQ